MDFDAALSTWLNSLTAASRSIRTIGSHRAYARRLGRFLDTRGVPWQQATLADLRALLATVAGKGHSLRRNLTTTLRVFYAFAVEQGWLAQSPAAALKLPRRPPPLPRALSRTQIRQVLTHLASQDGKQARRAEAVIVTALYTGARAHELASLWWRHIDYAGECISIPMGKTGGRAVAMEAELAALLERWQRLQGLGGDGPVFSLNSRPIVAQRIGKICKDVGDALGITLHAHALRHSAATWALRNGAGIYYVSRMLGHSDVATTARIYIKSDPTDSRVAVRALPKLSQW